MSDGITWEDVHAMWAKILNEQPPIKSRRYFLNHKDYLLVEAEFKMLNIPMPPFIYDIGENSNISYVFEDDNG